MDNHKAPGINFDAIHLLELHYVSNRSFQTDSPKVECKVDADYTPSLSEDKKTLLAELVVSVNVGIFDVRASLQGVFSVATDPNMTLEHFAEYNAPAILFPYARELIQNVTARGEHPALLLPPMNIFAMINAKKTIKKTPEQLHK